MISSMIRMQCIALAIACSGAAAAEPARPNILLILADNWRWAQGDFEVSGWQENPVGPRFRGFAEFHAKRDAARPFFFWIGNTDTATRGGKLPYLEAP
jgi:hypothetical protein